MSTQDYSRSPLLSGLYGNNAPSFDASPVQGFIPSYQTGGMIGPGGVPATAGLSQQGGGQQMSPQMVDMYTNQFASQHPEKLAQIKQAIQQALSSGELTQQELNMVVQLASVASQNPEMYPHVRRFAIQQGIATEQDLPQQYDQGLIAVILIAAKAAQANTGGQNLMQGGSPAMAGGASAPSAPGGQPIPSMATGGPTPDSKRMDGSVLVNAHEGEYVIPANVVKMKGREFFDSLLEKYKDAQ